MTAAPLALLLAVATFAVPDRVNADVDRETVKSAIQRCTMLPEGRDTILQYLANEGWAPAVPTPELTDVVQAHASLRLEDSQILQSPEFAAAFASVFAAGVSVTYEPRYATAEELSVVILDSWEFAMLASVNPDFAADQPFMRNGNVTLGVVCLAGCDEYFRAWCMLSGPAELETIARSIEDVAFEEVESPQFASPFSGAVGQLNGAGVLLAVFNPAKVVERIQQIGGVQLPYFLGTLTATEMVAPLKPVNLWISPPEEIE